MLMQAFTEACQNIDRELRPLWIGIDAHPVFRVGMRLVYGEGDMDGGRSMSWVAQELPSFVPR